MIWISIAAGLWCLLMIVTFMRVVIAAKDKDGCGVSAAGFVGGLIVGWVIFLGTGSWFDSLAGTKVQRAVGGDPLAFPFVLLLCGLPIFCAAGIWIALLFRHRDQSGDD